MTIATLINENICRGWLRTQRFSSLSSSQVAWWHAGRYTAGEGNEKSIS